MAWDKNCRNSGQGSLVMRLACICRPIVRNGSFRETRLCVELDISGRGIVKIRIAKLMVATISPPARDFVVTDGELPMIAARIETTVQWDGELHLTQLPCRKGDRIEAIILVLDGDMHSTEEDKKREAARQHFLAQARASTFRSAGLIQLAMNSMNAIDANIWVYSHDIRDPDKQLLAQQLVATVRPLVLPWQVGCEFIAAYRKLAATGFDETMAWSALGDMRSMAEDERQRESEEKDSRSAPKTARRG